jgi:hypothetical protein
LVKASYNFFATALNNEDEKYYRNNKAASDAVQMVFDAIEEDSSEETLLRIGRFSHLESMTFSGDFRQPSEKTHKRGWGKTRNLVNGNIPMGIVKLTFNKIA